MIAWAVSAGLLAYGMAHDHHGIWLLMIFTLTIAATLTSTGILVAMLAPGPAIYQAGFRDGAQSHGRPTLTVVRDTGTDRWF